jgi:hypothetical protein
MPLSGVPKSFLVRQSEHPNVLEACDEGARIDSDAPPPRKRIVPDSGITILNDVMDIP